MSKSFTEAKSSKPTSFLLPQTGSTAAAVALLQTAGERLDGPGVAAALDHLQSVSADWAGIAVHLATQLSTQSRPGAILVLEHIAEKAEWSALAHSNLGALYKEDEALDKSEAALRTAIALDPTFPDAWINLASCLYDQDRLEEAVTAGNTATDLAPHSEVAWYNLGLALTNLGLDPEAEPCFRRALAISPNWIDAHINLGVALARQSEPFSCLGPLCKAVELDPHHANAHLNLGLSLLRLGELEQGFAEYEWRRAGDFAEGRIPPCPEWFGEDLQGKRILVTCEQGFGDTLQFVRYLPLLRQQGATIVLTVQPGLERLMRGCAVADTLVVRLEGGVLENVPVCDYYVPLMTLPHRFGTTLHTVPWDGAYLHAPKECAVPLPPSTTEIRPLRVGIVWAGSTSHKNDRNRSAPLASFLQLATVPGVQIYSLQKGKKAEQQLQDVGDTSVINMSPQITDFADTAAIIEQLDIVVAVDTSVVHLAGAMGKHVWTLVPVSVDWRWMLDRDDNPWYPNVRVFRQKTAGDWQGAIDDVKRELAKAVTRHQSAFEQQLKQLIADDDDLPDAVQSLLETLAELGDDAVAHNAAATALWNAGAASECLEVLLRAYQCDPNNRTTVMNLVEVLGAMGLADDAGAVASGYAAMHPLDAEVAALAERLDHKQAA